MTKFTTLVRAASASVLALGLVGGAAMASGPVDTYEPPVAMVPPADPVQDWSGFYGGLSYSSVRGSTYENGVGPFNFGRDTGLGLFAGYNWQRGGLVYGAELNYTNFSTAYTGFPTFSQNDSLELRGRLGYVFDRVMVYGFVGGARSTIDFVGTETTQSGVSYGVGVQAMIGRSMFGGLELARRDVSGVTPVPNTEDTSIDTVSLRFGYQF